MPGIRVARFAVDAGARIRNHAHGNFHIFYVEHGELDQEMGTSSRRMLSGSVRASTANNRHSMDFGQSGAVCLVVHVTEPAIAGVSVPDDGASQFHDDPELAKLFTELPAYGAELWLGVREALAQVRLRSGPSQECSIPSWLRDVRAQLLELKSEARTSRLAQIGGISPEHLVRTFRRHYGATLVETRRAAMLSHAGRLLRLPDMPIVDAALEAGFSHQSHLTNAMRIMLGTTPRAYREYLAHRA